MYREIRLNKMKNKKMLKFFFLSTLLLIINSFVLKADIKLAALFSDNMVLQQQSMIPVWGWSKKNTTVTVKTSWNAKIYSIKSDEKGAWKLKISTPVASLRDYTISISDGNSVTLKNVLIGEVWLCAGQSNMEMPVKGRINQPTEGSLDAILHAKNRNIRLFTEKVNPSTTPQDTCNGTWSQATSASVSEFSAVGYFFGRLLNEMTNTPIGLIHCSLGGSRVEAWMSSKALEGIDKPVPAKDYVIKKDPQFVPTALFNGMIYPIIGFGMRGVLWYQGESNRSEPDLYLTMFQKMVNEWRELWGQGEFPFYYAQIAPFHYANTVNSAFLREAQLKAENLIPNSAMAVNLDADSPECIHPAKKKPIAERLALLALNKTYNMKGFPCESPKFTKTVIRDSIVELNFETYGNMGLTSFDKEIKGFKIAGVDKQFYPANAKISGSSILISAHEVKKPVAVRYAFENVVSAELFSLDGLPVSSFRTDNWTK